MKFYDGRIGLGLAALGRPGYINLGHDEDLGGEKTVAGMRKQAHRVLDAAWEAGVRYFDAARSYGLAEDFLSGWIRKRKIDAKDIFVASKWGYQYTADWQVVAEAHEIKEHSLIRLLAQYGESRDLLGTHLKLYQIHSATLDSGVLDNLELLNELGRMKAEGLNIGLTLSGPQQSETLQKAMEITRDGGLLFDSVQATWNILNPTVGESLQTAHDLGMRVIVKEALANGRLTTRNQNAHFAEKMKVLREIAEAKDTSVDALSIAAVLAQPWANVVLSGAARIDHLHSNLRSSEISISMDEMIELMNMKEENDDYWAKRSQLSWN